MSIFFSVDLIPLTDLRDSTFFLLSFVSTITMKAWFRTLAAAFKSPAPATAVAGLSTLVLILYTGYSLPQPYMIGALKWIIWINVSILLSLPSLHSLTEVHSLSVTVSRP